MQALGDSLPTVLAPKTIDNDLGLNYRSEPDEWVRHERPGGEFTYTRRPPADTIDLGQMVNFVTPGYATAVFVSAAGVERLRTTAESHRRIAIIEVMGRHSGYIALGACYGRPDLLLVPECPLDPDALVERIREIYDLQKNVVIVCGEGIVDRDGREFGAELASTDPAGNKILTGAAEALRSLLIARLGDDYFTSRRRNESARAAVFTRKVGHTQRGGRPVRFDRFYAAQLGGNAVDMLLDGRVNAVSMLQWDAGRGFHVAGVPANDFRDRWGLIHARQMHPSFYDPRRMRPSAVGVEYLQTIFGSALGADDVDAMGRVFAPGNLTTPYHSVNTDVGKRIRYLADGGDVTGPRSWS
jgi:6-phosphofructokinase 1